MNHSGTPDLRLLNSTEFPVLQQAAHLRLKVALSKLPADLKTLVAEVANTVPHPVLGVPAGIVTRDRHACEMALEQSQFMGGYSSNSKASAPVIGVYVWLVASELHGVGICVSYDVVRVPDTRTRRDIDNPVKGIRPKVLFLASPKLDDFDVVIRSWGRHIWR